MVLQKSYFDGASGYTFSMQAGKEDLSEEQIAAKKKATGWLPELAYQASGMAYELQGIENINGNDYYVLRCQDGMAESLDYYDTKSFLKYKSINISKVGEETVQTTTTYSDYQWVDGYLFAHSFTLNVGPMTLEGKVRSVTVNPSEVLPKDF